MMEVKAHALRAKLEGNRDMFKRLTKGQKYSRHDKTALYTDLDAAPRERWSFSNSTCGSSFLTDADMCDIIPGESLQSRSIFQTGKSGERPKGTEFPDVPPSISNFNVIFEPAWDQLDHEVREARYWGYRCQPPQPAPAFWFTSVLEERWCFHTFVSAKDFFPVLRQTHSEDYPGTVLQMQPTNETLPCLANGQHDGNVEVVVNLTSVCCTLILHNSVLAASLWVYMIVQ
jgi:hypothetical protein